MFCNKCQIQFDSNKHTPKLLIMCGHTLCQQCCYQIHKNNKIECIQCKTNTIIQKISLLPKNLALISLKKQQIKQCTKHSKKYQAFCSKQNLLICIECILNDGHKNHDMDSISKSYEKQIQNFNKKVQKIEQYLQSIKQKTVQNQQNQIQSRKNYQTANQIVQTTFKQIKQIIEEEQKNLLKSISDTFTLTDKKFTQKSQIYDQKLRQIQTILFRIQNDIQLNQVDFLQQISDRQQSFEKIKYNLYENSKPYLFTSTKNFIIQNLIKNINNSKNTLKNNSNNFNSIPTPNITNLQKAQKSPYVNNDQLKGIRKAAFSNMNICQNNKPQRKVSCKKDSISHQIQQNTQPTPILSLKAAQRQKVQKTQNIKSGIVLNPVQKNIKNEKKLIKNIEIIDDLNNGQISCVQPRQSLCHSFLSNMTSFFPNQKKMVYVLGGFNEQNNNNIIKFNIFNTFTNNNWEQVSLLNTNRSKFGSIFIDKKVYMFGGKKGKQRLNDVQVYDIQTNSTSKIGNMYKNKSGFGITSIEDEIYLIGGNDGQNILNSVEVYNVKTKEWKKLPSMNDARDQLAVVLGNDNKIYAIGGFGGIQNQPLQSAQVYDPKIKQWKYLPKMKYARRALSAAFLADGIYAIGGFDGSSYMSSVQKYQQNTNQWVQISSMNVARCTHTSISVFQTQQIFVFGGFDFLPLSCVQKYSLITNQWQIVCQMPFPRFMHSSVLVRQ